MSVYDKTDLLPFARGLVQCGFKLLSTGKTASFLRRRRIPVREISALTGYPELLDGRVKTLHPRIHAAILADRSKASHMKALRREGVEPIDLVAVDLYPFEEALRKKMSAAECLEQIDVGGVALLRAAAKNYRYVTVVPGVAFYGEVLKALKRGGIREKMKQSLACHAFLRTSLYDQAIRSFFNEMDKGKKELLPKSLNLTLRKWMSLRYGENPHQEGALYLNGASPLAAESLALQGRPLSYNNLLDLDAAYRIVRGFKKPACALIKHASPCGVSLGRTAEEAFERAWACDPESAFGGVVGLNRPLDGRMAKRILQSGFLEVIASPEITKSALRILKRKPNLRVVSFETFYRDGRERHEMKPLSRDIFLVQTPDASTAPFRWRCVTQKKPTREEEKSLRFAFQVAKDVRSNAAVIAKGETTVAIGGGQPSRVGAVRLAVEKAGNRAAGAVLASDGFFPFPDNIEVAALAGIHAMVQPGGSIRDGEVIRACNEFDVAMVLTGIRHFKH